MSNGRLHKIYSPDQSKSYIKTISMNHWEFCLFDTGSWVCGYLPRIPLGAQYHCSHLHSYHLEEWNPMVLCSAEWWEQVLSSCRWFICVTETEVWLLPASICPQHTGLAPNIMMLSAITLTFSVVDYEKKVSSLYNSRKYQIPLGMLYFYNS